MQLTLQWVCVGGDVLILEEAAYCDEGFFYVRHSFISEVWQAC